MTPRWRKPDSNPRSRFEKSRPSQDAPQRIPSRSAGESGTTSGEQKLEPASTAGEFYDGRMRQITNSQATPRTSTSKSRKEQRLAPGPGASRKCQRGDGRGSRCSDLITRCGLNQQLLHSPGAMYMSQQSRGTLTMQTAMPAGPAAHVVLSRRAHRAAAAPAATAAAGGRARQSQRRSQRSLR